MAARTRGKASETGESRWIDISIPLRNGMVHWPTDPPPRVERIKDVGRGDGVTLTELTIIVHTGTHIDAPLHFIPGGSTIDKMPLDVAVGPARVIEVKGVDVIRPELLERHDIRKGERILVKTDNSGRVYRTDAFVDDYVYFADETAQYLVERGVSLVGLDYISVGSIKSEGNVHATHQTLLKNGVYILEGINLAAVRPGNYELICVPLLVERGDAGPTRAILRRL